MQQVFIAQNVTQPEQREEAARIEEGWGKRDEDGAPVAAAAVERARMIHLSLAYAPLMVSRN